MIEAEVFAVVQHDADLLEAAVTAVVPEQPFAAVEDGVRLVAGVGVHFSRSGWMMGLAGCFCQWVTPSLLRATPIWA